MLSLHPGGHCPSCSSREICRSRRRGVLERVLLRPLLIRPHRCRSCDFRFYVYGAQVSVRRAG
jgi:hypothetical protein